MSTLLPAGLIFPYAGTKVPKGFFLCNGASLNRAKFPALFSAIGTQHGAADSAHFNLPDYRGQFLRGTDHGAGRDPDAAGRTAPLTGGATGDAVGSIQGSANLAHRHLQGEVSKPGPVYGQVNQSPTRVDWAGFNGSNTYPWTQTVGGSEARPINANVDWIIKY